MSLGPSASLADQWHALGKNGGSELARFSMCVHSGCDAAVWLYNTSAIFSFSYVSQLFPAPASIVHREQCIST
eukprot:3730277-Pyramimonas_sp.AAC.1